MKFSAAKLVKKSAAQLVYEELNRVKEVVTSNQIIGDNYAKEIIKKKGALGERRGTYKFGSNVMYFVIDMIKDNVFTEIKHVKNQQAYKNWYFQNSIIQSVLYCSLLDKVNYLDTPWFMEQTGVQQYRTEIPPKRNYCLKFGKHLYEVFPNENIVDFYEKKALVVKKCIKRKDYKPARKFDELYKFKEFELFKKMNVINYKKLETMLPGWEDYTENLSEHQKKEVVPLVAKALAKHVGEENAISNSSMCVALNKEPYFIKLDSSKMRKVIQYIRVSGILSCLIASGKGYYVAKDATEMQHYLHSLTMRVEAQEFMLKSMLYQSRTKFK